MARPAPLNRRHDIVAAAREEFNARGFAGARMDDIAARAGISKAAVYLQFASKEAVFRALVGDMIAAMMLKIAPQELGDRPAPELLRQFITAAFAQFTSPEVAFLPRLIVGESRSFPELARFYHDEGILRIMANITGMIRHGTARGEFQCDRPDHAARSIAGGMVLGALWRIVCEPVGAEPLNIDEAAHTHADTILNGLLVRKDSC